ncbi:HD family phosphohydrolase [Compostibacillus humi]|uniref:HD family phosphohydrolase n=1 Tax=Compostibacillus humi TaxID=1245525 RepID=A0A8J2XG63_9BACI|nr:HD-GYP domain-containing protein [Compostibacillus humi]GFZ86842.1 HD family phosphohydrolase [Compostibacillus humi]HLT56914.1 HD-GYP domain-containing protein [Bacillota bacterium]
MDKLAFYLKEIIGKRSIRDIYDQSGELLVPISTVITYDHIILLEEKGITLKSEDVQDLEKDFINHSKIINETVEDVRNIFGEIRETKKIPLNELRESIIPIVYEVSDSKYLLPLLSALQAKDDYTYRHNIAVGAIANLIGKWMGLDQQQLLQLTVAGLLHDVGKMLIPETILNKPGKLTYQEFIIMQKHTIYGYEILKETIGVTHRQALVALQHHERMDGSGYPMGIKGDKIDLFSRIVAVADVFHAMTSRRVYQDQFPFYKVVSEIERSMFDSLDPAISIVFIEKIMSALIGSSILLSDGRAGKIVMVPKNYPTRPLIQVGEEFIDLTIHSDLQIEKINFR